MIDAQKALFESSRIGSITLRNRFIRSATHESMADADGTPTGLLEGMYVRLAKGGVGAIVTGYAGVLQDGRSSFPGMLMMHEDAVVPAYRRLTDAVHREGAPLVVQLAHCGRQTRSMVTGRRTVAPSSVRDSFFSEDVPHELSESEILEIIEAFSCAAVRARASGFDGVQLHLAHGYLLSEFLSGQSNRRRDRWGGSLENRFRIVSEIMKSIRRKLGDYPVLAKMNGYDGVRGGMRVEEAVRIAGMLESSGCQAIEISSGTVSEGLSIMRGPRFPIEAVIAANFKFLAMPEMLKPVMVRVLPLLVPSSPKPFYAYNFDAAKAIRSAVSIPVILVGGIHTLEAASAVFRDGVADFVSMARPFIKDPAIVRKFRDGSQTVSRCTMCNYCAIMIEQEPLRCWNGRLSQKP